jgi:hypothetical protein
MIINKSKYLVLFKREEDEEEAKTHLNYILLLFY